MVNRESGMVENTDGSGNLFETNEYYSSEPFDLYISSNFSPDILEKTLKLMLSLGIGAQRSVGKGAFELLEFKNFNDFIFPKKPNAFVALSNFIPKKCDPIRGYYKTFTKYPKLSRVTGNNDSPFKKPVLFLRSGSIFFDDNINEYYGRCLEHIALINGKVSDDIIIGAYTIAIPCCIRI